MYLFISDDIMQALCRTLLYSLLAGAAASVLAALIIFATRKTKAVFRYNLLLLVFVLLAVVTGFTLVRQLQLAGSSAPVAGYIYNAGETAAVTGGAQAATNAAVAETGWLTAVHAFCNRYAGIIVLMWLLVIAFKTARLVLSFRATNRLRLQQVTAAPEHWQQWLAAMQARLGITKPVLLLQSARVQVPLTFGMLKPLVLIPMGALSGLKPAEVEAILLHELAHVARKDYLVNILQTVTETLLFFNPGVLWISRLIRDERENCCDDLALTVTGNRLDYVKALVSFQEYHLHGNNYALAFAGNRTPLLKRARRILLNNNITLSNMEKLILSAVIVAVCTVIFAFSVKKSGKDKVPAFNAANQEYRDTIPAAQKIATGREARLTLADNKEYRLVESKDGSYALHINGQPATAAETAQHKKTIEALKQLMRAVDLPAGKTEPALKPKVSDDDIPDMPADDNTLPMDDIPKGPFIDNEQLAKDLVAEKVIGNKSEMQSYKFTYDELVVNGKKIPADVHLRLREKHKVAKGPGQYYNYAFPIDRKA